jgi:hypothetical protein
MERQMAAKAPRGNGSPAAKQSRSARAPVHPILALQQTIGNQAVQRLIQSQQIQAKLKISQPGDPYEQEADEVADTVMRMPEPAPSEEQKTTVQTKPLATQITPLVQQKSEPAPEEKLEEKKEEVVAPKPLLQRAPIAVREDDDEEEKRVLPKLDPAAETQEDREEKSVQAKPETNTVIHRQTEEDEEKPKETLQTAPLIQRQMEKEDEEELQVQPKEGQLATAKPTTSLATNIQALNSGGSPLPDATRSFFEPRFGADFSQVRVHTDTRAAATAKSINAKAFTVGWDIAFGAGQYAPQSHEGQHLLAHELTHVMQQGGAGTPAPAARSIARQPDPAPPDPVAELTDNLANYLLQVDDVSEALELSKGTVRKLTRTAEKMEIVDEGLKQGLAALDKKKRSKVVAAAMAQVESVLKERRARRVTELAEEIATRTTDRFVKLAKVARDAEVAEEEEFEANPKRKGKRRPQFGVIRKYILKDTIERQIDSPRSKPYPLRVDYATPLGLAKDEELFPRLHEEDFVAELKKITKSMRKALKEQVSQKTIEALPDYIQERMGTVPKAILEEWEKEFDLLRPEVKGIFESGFNDYFAVRMELLKLFGSPTDVPATIKAINEYFTKELVKCDFLKASGVKMAGPGNTLVHKDLNEALKKAEDFMKDPSRKWLDDVVASVSPLGYWATNIRENRNNPARPSEHTYGFAVDINADLNPNLAKLTPADWDFVSAMAGERAIFEQGGKTLTEGAKSLRSPSTSTEDKMLEAMKKIRSQSASFVSTFASDSSLRARLRGIVSARSGKGKTQAQIDALLDLAREATKGPAKDRAKAAKSLKTTLEADIFSQEPIASELTGTPSRLRDKLVKLLAPVLRPIDKVTAADAAIRAQIMSPVDKATADAKKHRIGALFGKGVVKELNEVATADRAELARVVLRDLREPLIRKSTDADARALADLLKRGFNVLDATTDKSGAKVGTGAGMGNIAVHGFSNLNEKLVVALVHPQGGNLIWLGVHNQDMHHFQLRSLPKIPKATITVPATVPKPSDPPPPPAVAP